MPETQEPVRPVLVDFTCDSCGKGKMRPDPVESMLLTLNEATHQHSVKFKHTCTECGCKATYSVKYPTIKYV